MSAAVSLKVRLLASCVVFFAALALSLIVLESYLRRTETYAIDPRKGVFKQLLMKTPHGWRLAPNTKAIIRNHKLSRRSIPMEINSFGFRGPEISSPKPAGTYRILVLGDSIALSEYMLEPETYVRRIESHLREESGANVEVVNGGQSDIGLAEELDILMERGLQIEPDLVVIGFYLNDSRPPWGFSGELGHRGWLRRHSLVAEMLYRHFAVQRWLGAEDVDRFAWGEAAKKLDWRHDHGAFVELATLARYDWGAAWDPDSWPAISKGFEQLQALSRAHGFKVAIVAFPVVYQVEADLLDDAPQKKLRELADRFGFPYDDLLPVLRSHANESMFYDHCHLRPPASDIVGSEIARFLATHLATPEQRQE